MKPEAPVHCQVAALRGSLAPSAKASHAHRARLPTWSHYVTLRSHRKVHRALPAVSWEAALSALHRLREPKLRKARGLRPKRSDAAGAKTGPRPQATEMPDKI